MRYGRFTPDEIQQLRKIPTLVLLDLRERFDPENAIADPNPLIVGGKVIRRACRLCLMYKDAGCSVESFPHIGNPVVRTLCPLIRPAYCHSIVRKAAHTNKRYVAFNINNVVEVTWGEKDEKRALKQLKNVCVFIDFLLSEPGRSSGL